MNVLYSRLPDRFTGAPPMAAAGWLLRLAVAGFCAGAAASLLLQMGSGLGSYFFLEHAVPDTRTGYGERIAAYTLLAVGLLTVIKPHWLFLAPLAALVILEACARVFNGGAPFAEWTVYAYALRYVAPVALLLLVIRRPANRLSPAGQARLTAWVLRVAIAVVFICHGVEAFLQHPRFLDYIIGSADRMLGLGISEAQAGMLLRIIGIVDVAVAFVVLIRPYRGVLYWMAFWGLITALARVTTYGFDVYYEVLVRFPHFLAPLAVVFLVKAVKTLESEKDEAIRNPPNARTAPST